MHWGNWHVFVGHNQRRRCALSIRQQGAVASLLPPLYSRPERQTNKGKLDDSISKTLLFLHSCHSNRPKETPACTDILQFQIF